MAKSAAAPAPFETTAPVVVAAPVETFTVAQSAFENVEKVIVAKIQKPTKRIDAHLEPTWVALATLSGYELIELGNFHQIDQTTVNSNLN